MKRAGKSKVRKEERRGVSNCDTETGKKRKLRKRKREGRIGRKRRMNCGMDFGKEAKK